LKFKVYNKLILSYFGEINVFLNIFNLVILAHDLCLCSSSLAKIKIGN